MLLKSDIPHYKEIEHLHHKDEARLVKQLLKDLGPLQHHQDEIVRRAKKWVEEIQKTPLKGFNIQKFLQAFPLTHEEGRSLMALAEAYLRVPDSFTANLLLDDKISDKKWSRSKGKGDILVKASRWGLDFTKYLQKSPLARVAQPITLQAFKSFMQLMSHEFILGQTIEGAVKRAAKTPEDRFSYDMLGEGARTKSMAAAYKLAYSHAIQVIGNSQNDGRSNFEKNSISVKLSALHPHYNFAHRDQVMDELLPDLIELCGLAKQAGIALTVDAEEVSRLELSLDLMTEVCHASELQRWDGFGLAVQAYQKSSPAVIDWAQSTAKKTKRPLMVRLVKGAYWDTEIKLAQVGGFPDYPVYTRRAATDLSYLTCAEKLLKAEGHLFPQFATHNAFTVSAILEMAKGRKDIEFQRLQGMGKELYSLVREKNPVPVRVYAPVGSDHDLLAYLVRRLLENGANTSFVHKIHDKDLSTQEVLGDPWDFFKDRVPGSHPNIRMPRELYGKERANSKGYDLNDRHTVDGLKNEIENANLQLMELKKASLNDLDEALEKATQHQPSWDLIPAEKRAEMLIRASDLLEERRGLFLKLLIEEGKKTLPDAVAELREAVDFCRYYAKESIKNYGDPHTLVGPTGELNQLSLHGRGVFACISPWNFPLAIFMGQVTAALATGNAVLAKPASATPRIGFEAIRVLHDAGVPKDVLHFLYGSGNVLGTPLIKDLRIKGVVFTGSTSTAQEIQEILTSRGGPIVPFIAETGGLNTMIVDSTALFEQVVDEVMISAFQSAGQRCSALRILFIQEDVYEPLLKMLKEAMMELNVGDPQWLSTDVGPVINEAARDEIEAYIKSHKLLARTPLGKVMGTFVAPTIIEVKGMDDVKKEVFGPVLHVGPYKAKDFEKLVHSINQAGYGLTMGLQTRIERTIGQLRQQAHVGNLYVNRNMIGAVVGVQPFGGEGLSGTGPKAGGPHYLPRFGVERTFSYNIMASGGNVALLNLEE